MDADDLGGIRYALQNKYGFRVVTHPQVVLVSALINEPGTSAGKLQRKITKTHGFSRSSIFKTYRKLREFNVVDEYGNITFTGYDMRPRVVGERLAVPLVGFVKERILPDEDYYMWTQLAAWIAQQSDCVEICQAIKNSYSDMAELVPLLKEMQNGLALCAIMAGDIGQWVDMKGTVALNEEAQELLKKAGVKT